MAKDETEAVKWYRKAAEQGVALAQTDLGNCYLNGIGVSKDGTEAMKWFRTAADQGFGQAAFIIAECYRYGEGAPGRSGRRQVVPQGG